MNFYHIVIVTSLLLVMATCKIKQDTTLPDNCNATCPDCPAKDTSLFTAGQLTAPESYGTWVTLGASCQNKKYLFSNCGLTWEEAYKKCCTLGIGLLSFKTADDTSCFATASTGINGAWWTSGTSEGCTLKTRLYSRGAISYIDFRCASPRKRLPCDKVEQSQLITWDKKEPDNYSHDKEKCLLIKKTSRFY